MSLPANNPEAPHGVSAKPTISPVDQINLESSRFRDANRLMEKFMGRRPESRPEDSEAQRIYDSLHQRTTILQQEAVIRAILVEKDRKVYEWLARNLTANEDVRRQAREKLSRYRKSLEALLETVGQTFRAPGNPEVAEEEDTILMRNFILQLSRVENPEEFIDIVIDLHVQDVLEMLREINQNPDGPLLGILQVDNPDKEKAARASANYDALRDFIRQTYSGEISDRRKTIYAQLWGPIVARMSFDQRTVLFSRFMDLGERPEWEPGAREVSAILFDLVRTGNMSATEAFAIIMAKEFQVKKGEGVFGEIMKPSEFEKELKKAQAEFERTQKIIQTNVEYVKQRFYGNPAAHMLSLKGGVLGIGATLIGSAALLTNALIEGFIGAEKEKGLWKIVGFAGGLAKTPLNHYALGGLVLGGVGLNILTKGGVADRLLYSRTVEEKEIARKMEIERKLKKGGGLLANYPGLRSYFTRTEEDKPIDNYGPLQEKARRNASFGAGYGYTLHDADIPLTDKDIEALGLTVPSDPHQREAIEKTAKNIIREAFVAFSRDLGFKNIFELNKFFDKVS